MAKANPFRFSTKYQDDETDLLYYGRRYLNTSTGRWLTRGILSRSWEGRTFMHLLGMIWWTPTTLKDCSQLRP